MKEVQFTVHVGYINMFVKITQNIGTAIYECRCKRTLQYPLAELEKMMTSLKLWHQSGIRDMLQHARAKRVDTREKYDEINDRMLSS